MGALDEKWITIARCSIHCRKLKLGHLFDSDIFFRIYIDLFQNKIKRHNIFFDWFFGQNIHPSTFFGQNTFRWTLSALGSKKAWYNLCITYVINVYNHLQNWYTNLHSKYMYIYVELVNQKAFFYAFINHRKNLFFRLSKSWILYLTK